MEYRDNATPIEVVSGAFGTEVITLASLIGQGEGHSCRECFIWTVSTNPMTFGESAVMANNGCVMPPGVLIPMKVSNTNKIHFNGTDADDAYILWRT